jgi:hypothetical protein
VHAAVAFGNDVQNREYSLKKDKNAIELGKPSLYTNRRAVSEGKGGDASSAGHKYDTHDGFVKFIKMYETTNLKSRTCFDDDDDACCVYLRHHICL